ncbi:MAG: hypothetical protein WC683_03975 [bacterium]
MPEWKGEYVKGNLVSNLQKLASLNHPMIVLTMEIAGNNVVEHAKANHRRPPESPAAVREHSDPRFYTRTGNLVNSMRAENAQVSDLAITVPVVAGDTRVDYAAIIETGRKSAATFGGGAFNPWAALTEFGGAGRRAFPFFRPAIMKTARRNFGIIGEGVRRTLIALSKGLHFGGGPR